MDRFQQHVLICDPQPSENELEKWRELIAGMAASIMKTSSPRRLFEICNDLAHIVENRATGNEQLASPVAMTLADAESNRIRGEGTLYPRVCAMLAVREVLAGGGGPKRGVVAMATWSALSFGAPLSEPRLEALRREILVLAQHESLRMGERARQRPEGPVRQIGARGGTAVKQELIKVNNVLRKNAGLDQEEIALLRWLLADRSAGLGLAFRDIGPPVTAALAMGMELGRLLNAFPAVAHYRLGTHFVRESPSLDIRQVVAAVGADQARLAALFSDERVTKAWPAVFPLVTALAGRPVKGSGRRTKRSLMEWWERAVLESSATGLASKRGWS